jgi:hypothetical protein
VCVTCYVAIKWIVIQFFHFTKLYLLAEEQPSDVEGQIFILECPRESAFLR